MRALMTMTMAGALLASPAWAQKMGEGGTAVNGAQVLEKCQSPLGTVSLVEENKAAAAEANLPPGMAAMLAMARAQQGGARVDPLPLLKLLAAQSGCFQVVDRGAAFNAIQQERMIAQGGQTTGGAPGATLRASDYVLVAQMVYEDSNAGGGGFGAGALGGFGGVGSLFKSSRKEAQTLLTLSKVSTGVQEAAVTGQARKKDVGLAIGGLLGLGIGALGGGYESTDMGKVTAAALLDGFNKLVVQVRDRSAAAAGASVATPAPALTAAAAGPAPNYPRR